MTPPTYLAKVQNGRLVLDEPTDLPEGAAVELVPSDLEDDLALHKELEESIAEIEAGGELVDAEVFLAELRAMR